MHSDFTFNRAELREVFKEKSIDEYIGFVFIFTAQPRYSYFGNYNNSLR